MTFRPLDFQVQNQINDTIIENPSLSDETTVPLDVLFVGAGPSGLAGAIALAQMIKEDPDLKDTQIGVLEKASDLGGHNLSGAVMNPGPLRHLFPELKDTDFPFKNKIEHEKVLFLTEKGSFSLPTPPTMKNQGNYSISICELVRWLGGKAEELGVNLLTNFPAHQLLSQEGQIRGVRTTSGGLDRQGKPGPQFTPPTDITASLTVLTEGTRGVLTQSYLEKNKIAGSREQIYALGVKELWKVKKPLKNIIHTMGWPLKNEFGGSWLYPMGEDQVSLGLVVGLDYKNARLDVHHLLQNMKNHPLFSEILEGGELLEWGAKTIPEGGFLALPQKFSGNGIMICGDAAGMVNVPALKGIHYAIQSGIYAAETAYKALKKRQFDESILSDYDRRVKESFIYSDLKKVRNMRQAFKGGFWLGAAKAGLMTLTQGSFPPIVNANDSDAHEEKSWKYPSIPEGKLSKVDAVYLSGNKTRDDIPQHLIVGQDIPKEIAEFYSHLCPAGVYEVKEGKLIINSPNCIDCKATDILGPRWFPREGGSGPHYKNM